MGSFAIIRERFILHPGAEEDGTLIFYILIYYGYENNID